MGITLFAINVHVQAVVMWSFVLLAVYGLWVDRSQHGRSQPLVLGVASFVIIFGTLYTVYDQRLEVLGYITVLLAAFLNQYYLMEHYQRQIAEQAGELEEMNASLESRVADQVGEIDKLARLKRFLSPEVIDLVTSEGNEHLLDSHRRLVACLFLDVRNFTSFSESAEPEEVMEVLQAIHARAGKLLERHRGTIGYRAGDGLMVIFNDPLPCEEPVLEAARLALELRPAIDDIVERWSKLGHRLGIGIGIAHGYATLGLIGGEGRYDYTAIGNVVNIAARLCDAAFDGQILVDQRAALALEDRAELEPKGPLRLKNVAAPVDTHNLVSLRHPS